jgi:3-(3-hydroxy-phenyl)propionate hydroxylase
MVDQEAMTNGTGGGAPIVIVGLGPVGVTLAGLLALRGHRVVGFDREVDVFPLPRAAHIDHTGLRTLQELGCLDELMAGMIPNPGLAFVTADERVLAEIPGNQSSPSGLPASMYFHQPGFDRTLRETVVAMPGVEFHTNTVVLELEDRGADVRVRARKGWPQTGGPEFEMVASFVIGCDGASGPVRSWLGIELEDLGFHERWIVVDLNLREEVSSLPTQAVTYCDPKRPLGIVPMPGMRYRFELMLMPGEDPEQLQRPDAITELISRWVPPGTAEIERGAAYKFDGVVAARWRQGRVLLAGDAAHRMPPFLGQGMNTGVRDAVNLAWKLDLVARGRGPSELLDTYCAERKPNVSAVVESAVRIGRVVCELDPAAAERRNKAFLSGEVDPWTALGFKLPRLERGPLVLEGGGHIAVQTERDGRRLDDVVGGRFLVLARDERALEGSADFWRQQLEARVATVAELGAFEADLVLWLDRIAADVVVVRPDRYVLAAGAGLDAITAAVQKGPLMAAAERTTG